MTTERKTNGPAIDATVLTEPSGTPYGLRLAFSNGKTLEITAGGLSAEIRAYALVHGLKQKLVDAAAISRDPDTGRAATIDTKYEAVREVWERLHQGEWNKRREGGAGATGGLLYRALVRIIGEAKTAGEIKAFLAAKTDAEQAALRATPRVKAVIDEIKAEDAARRVGEGGEDKGEEMLGELLG